MLIELTLGAGIGKGTDDWVWLHKHSFYELKLTSENWRIGFACIDKLHRIQHSMILRVTKGEFRKEMLKDVISIKAKVDEKTEAMKGS